MPIIQGVFTLQGTPINGVPCNLWASTAGFSPYPPQMDTPEPAGSPTASATTGEGNGGDGAYLFNNVVAGEWWVAQKYLGHIVWDYFNLPRRSATVILCEAFTPAGTGADIAEVMVPYDPKDGTSSVAWTVRRVWLRLNVAGGAPSVTIEKSTASGVFSASSVATLTLGSGAFEGATNPASTTVFSGNKLRFSVATLGTATGWTIGVELAA